MLLHKISKDELSDDHKVVNRMMSHINYSYMKEKYRCKLFISDHLAVSVFSQTDFVMPPFDVFKKGGLIGKIGGTDVYVSDILNDDEIFIGNSEQEIEVVKRKDKITKILNR